MKRLVTKIYVEYYSCSICGKNFSDETATTELEDVIVNVTGHTAGKWEVTKQATATETGIKVQRCSVCGEILNTAVIPIAESESETETESETESDGNTETSETKTITLTPGSDGNWYCTENGEISTTYNGIVEYDGATFKVVNGQLYS